MRLIIMLFALFSLRFSADLCMAEEQVKFGVIAPLTGSFSSWGESIKRGIEVAITETRHPFVVSYADDGCNAEKADLIAREFFTQKGIRFVFGPGCAQSLISVAPHAKRIAAILFSTGVVPDDAFLDNQPVISLASQITPEAHRLARRITKVGVKQLAAVYVDSPFGREYAKRLEEGLMPHGVQTVRHTTSLGVSDFSSLISEVLSKSPDGVFIYQGEQEFISLVKQIRAKNPTIAIFSQYRVESEASRKEAKALEGVNYTYPVNEAEGSPEKVAFDKKFKAKFGEDSLPSVSSYYVYDGVKLFDNALNQCLSFDTQCVRDYFCSRGVYRGISGVMRFRPDGRVERPYGIKRVSDGKFLWVTKES